MTRLKNNNVMKKILTLLTIALSLVLINHSCKPEPEPELLGSIYGVVTDKATGEPVKTAGVELSPLGLKTVTGSEGQFEFTELEPGNYQLYVTKTGYTELVSSTIVVKSDQTAKGDVQIEKLPAALRVVDDKGDEIDELNFGNNYDDVSRMFCIFNDGSEVLEYEVVKTASWIESLSSESGSLQPGATKPVVVNINRDKLALGENTTTLHITSNSGSKQLTIHVEKLKVLNVVDDDGNEVNELDFGSDNNDLSRTFNIVNNGGSVLNYQITKSVDWISKLSSSEGSIDGGGTLVIVVTIDRAKLSVGDNSTTLIISTNNGSKQIAVKAKMSAPELLMVDNDGNEISKLDFGTNKSSVAFNVFNDGYNAVDYQIIKTVEWIESISNAEGTVEAGLKKPVVVAINRNIIPLGDNSTMLQITSDIGSEQLEVKCNNGSISTYAATEVTYTSAKLNAIITANDTYTEKGFYLGKNSNATDKYVVEGSGAGNFSYVANDLEEGETYYYKAYLVHNGKTYYGDVKEFTVLDPKYNGHGCVDLGLPSGLKWATCNMGANSPSEYGNYLTYYEAASSSWGGSWRCPTYDELNELRTNCSWTWTKQDGVNGYKVTGNNGNSIFLPAAGQRDSGSLNGAGSWGLYWSSSPYMYIDFTGFSLGFNSDGHDMYYSYCSDGLSVRLVAE